MSTDQTDTVVPMSPEATHQAERQSDPAENVYFVDPFPGPDSPLAPEIGTFLSKIQAHLKMPIWFLVQNGQGQLSNIDFSVFKAFQNLRNEIEPDKPVCLFLDSPGGDASSCVSYCSTVPAQIKQLHCIDPTVRKECRNAFSSWRHEHF
ncbi:MAG: hypothetical protein KGJ55_09720, partial [Gammaproteobacteria bacterium]|nr:hypothetical protein [Gammaproteobacteria bacterium]